MLCVTLMQKSPTKIPNSEQLNHQSYQFMFSTSHHRSLFIGQIRFLCYAILSLQEILWKWSWLIKSVAKWYWHQISEQVTNFKKQSPLYLAEYSPSIFCMHPLFLQWSHHGSTSMDSLILMPIHGVCGTSVQIPNQTKIMGGTHCQWVVHRHLPQTLLLTQSIHQNHTDRMSVRQCFL